MKEKFQNPQTVIRWLFAGFTVICLLAAVLVSDRGGMLDGAHLHTVRPDSQKLF